MSHPHGCVNWNRFYKTWYGNNISRTLTGAWIETSIGQSSLADTLVAPSRVRELKLTTEVLQTSETAVAPSRVRELKLTGNEDGTDFDCRTLTGAWIETPSRQVVQRKAMSHPHGCVNWNDKEHVFSGGRKLSHPHGCVNWNYSVFRNFNS